MNWRRKKKPKLQPCGIISLDGSPITGFTIFAKREDGVTEQVAETDWALMAREGDDVVLSFALEVLP